MRPPYEIRFCRWDEREKIQRFIDKYWQRDHVLARSSLLFDWQHLDRENNRYNFVMGVHRDSGRVDGILGFIPTYHFDLSLKQDVDVWLALWKVNSQLGGTGILGLDLLSYLTRELRPRSIGSVGINETAEKIYQALKFKTGRLNHYYILNPLVKDYKILMPGEKRIGVSTKGSPPSLELLHRPEAFSHLSSSGIPTKSATFMINRFAKHPIYSYFFYGVSSGRGYEAVLVIRKISANGASCLRLVDIWGEVPRRGSLAPALIELLSHENAEYVDLFNYGIEKEVWLRLGFQEVQEPVVVPNYFEPFERRNVPIRFGYKAPSESYVIFKADGDQDRPNQIQGSGHV